jgi:hypothetical protein
VWNSNSISTTYHSGQLEFDYRAFDAVARVLVESVVVAVRSDARWKTLNDLVAEAKAKPKAISVGHSGIGSHTHISLAALFSAAGAEVNEVPFGAAQVVPSLLGGHVDAVVQLPRRCRRRSSRARCACSRRSSRAAIPLCPKSRLRASRASTCRSKPGAASPCPMARRAPVIGSPGGSDPAHGGVVRIPEKRRERRRAACLPAGGAVRRAYFEGGRGAVAPDAADWSEEDAVAGAFFGTFAARSLSFVASATS